MGLAFDIMLVVVGIIWCYLWTTNATRTTTLASLLISGFAYVLIAILLRWAVAAKSGGIFILSIIAALILVLGTAFLLVGYAPGGGADQPSFLGDGTVRLILCPSWQQRQVGRR